MGAGANADAIRAALKDPEVAAGRTSNDVLDHDPVSAFINIISEHKQGSSNYGEIYRKWRGHPAAKNGWDQEPWGTAQDNKVYGELHDSEFFRLDASAQRLAGLAGAADAMKTAITGMQGRLQNAWRGKAADAAASQFDTLAKSLQTYHDTLTTISTALSSASGASWPAVFAIAYKQDGNTAFVDSAPEPMTIAEPSTQIDRINYRLYTEHSYTIEQLKQASTCDLNEGAGMFSDTWWSDETIRGLDKMCDEYNASIRWFRERLAAAHKAVKDSWTTLNGQLTTQRDTGDLDPFAKLALPTGQPDDGSKDQDPGIVGPGTQQPPPGTTDPSQVDPGQVGPGQVGPGTTDPNQQQPLPGQTTPSQTDPGVQPVPGRPTGGKESVTIKDGDRTITVDSEDGGGHVHLSVDDGTGKPKDYDLDFGDDPGDKGSFNGDLSGTGQNGGDGKVTIHDGATTITAERHGGDGSISLTVDDGSGHPTEYSVDFDDSGTQSPGQSQTPQQHDSGTGGNASDASASAASNPSDASSSAASSSSTASSGGSTGVGAGGGPGGTSGGGGGGGGGYSGTGTDGSAGTGSPGTSGQETRQPGAVTGAAPQGGNQGGQQAVAPAAAAGPGQAGGGMGGGGMPMMGGMGGGHGSGGGDHERTASQWRTEGNLFTDPDPAERFDGVIGDDAPNRK